MVNSNKSTKSDMEVCLSGVPLPTASSVNVAVNAVQIVKQNALLERG
jgi:hypothetical protein